MLGVSVSWGTLPNPFDWAAVVAFVQSITISLTGSVGNSDIGAGAVTADKATPGAYFFGQGVLSGSVGSKYYAVTSASAPATAYSTGLWFLFQADVVNEGGAGVTTGVNLDGLGLKKLVKWGGTELEEAEILAGYVVLAMYDGTVCQVLSVTARPALMRAGTAGGTATALTATLTPSTLTLADLTGQEIEITAASAATGAATLQVNALAAAAMKKNGTAAIAIGDWVTGQVLRVQYDGTNFQVLTPLNAGVANRSVRGLARELVVEKTGASTVAINAQEIVLKNDTGNEITVAVSVSVDISVAGANGLDAGAEQTVGIWPYSIWVVSDGVNVKGLFSLARPIWPGVPSLAHASLAGYSYYACVGVVFNSGGTFRDFRRIGNRTSIPEVGIGPYATGSFIAGDFSNYVPLDAIRVRGMVGNTAAGYCGGIVAGDSAGAHGTSAGNVADPVTTITLGGVAFRGVWPFEVALHEGSTSIYLKTAIATCYVIVTEYDL